MMELPMCFLAPWSIQWGNNSSYLFDQSYSAVFYVSAENIETGVAVIDASQPWVTIRMFNKTHPHGPRVRNFPGFAILFCVLALTTPAEAAQQSLVSPGSSWR